MLLQSGPLAQFSLWSHRFGGPFYEQTHPMNEMRLNIYVNNVAGQWERLDSRSLLSRYTLFTLLPPKEYDTRSATAWLWMLLRVSTR